MMNYRSKHIRKITFRMIAYSVIIIVVASIFDSKSFSGDHPKNSIKKDYFLLSGEGKNLLADEIESLSRPTLPDSFLSSEGHFNIHYTTQGNDSVSITDSNVNLVPDRIEQIAFAFEKSFSVECKQFQYRIPPTMNNGLSPYDIYIVDLNNKYAVTKKVGFDSSLTVMKNVQSYI